MLKFTGDCSVVNETVFVVVVVVVEYGEVVSVGIAVRGRIFSVGGVDDGGIKATGAFHLSGGGEWESVVIESGMSVEIEIQHCESLLRFSY
jgi:hypothetical protein